MPSTEKRILRTKVYELDGARGYIKAGGNAVRFICLDERMGSILVEMHQIENTGRMLTLEWEDPI